MKIACYQQNIHWENPAANHRAVEACFDQLTGPVDIMVVPETFSTGFSDNMARLAEQPLGPTFRFALRMAVRHDALFVGTWTVRESDGRVFNRLHWVAPDGSWGRYDKGHTFRMSSEASQLARGVSRETFLWRGWRIRPAVCYDLRFPKWLRNIPLQHPPLETLSPQNPMLDYDLLLVCANWPASRSEAWATLLKARAIENLCYVAGVNRVGEDGVGIPYSGHSAVVDFKGNVVVQGQTETEALIVADLDLDSLNTFRLHWPFFLDFD